MMTIIVKTVTGNDITLTIKYRNVILDSLKDLQAHPVILKTSNKIFAIAIFSQIIAFLQTARILWIHAFKGLK